jgi:ribosomal protein S18 acetylase RimI-like enzyme
LIRALLPNDLDTVCALVRGAVGGSPYEARLVEVARAAVLAPNVETRGLAAEEQGTVAGAAVYGEFSGAQGAGRLHFVAVADGARGRGIGTALVSCVARELRESEARFLLAEVPDDPARLGDYWALLARCGFREESRVDDLFRERIALAFLRLDLTP